MMRKTDKRHGHPMFYEILEEAAKLHSQKNKDFATESDPLGNFNRVAEWALKYKLITPGQGPLKIAMIYMLKQLDAALKLLGAGQAGDVEDIPERLRDILVYSGIGEILYGEGDDNAGTGE